MMGVSAAMDVLSTPLDASGAAFWREQARNSTDTAESLETKAENERNSAAQKYQENELQISKLDNWMDADYASSAWGKTLAASAKAQYAKPLTDMANAELARAKSMANKMDNKATADLKAASTDEYNASIDSESLLERIF